MELLSSVYTLPLNTSHYVLLASRVESRRCLKVFTSRSLLQVLRVLQRGESMMSTHWLLTQIFLSLCVRLFPAYMTHIPIKGGFIRNASKIINWQVWLCNYTRSLFYRGLRAIIHIIKIDSKANSNQKVSRRATKWYLFNRSVKDQYRIVLRLDVYFCFLISCTTFYGSHTGLSSSRWCLACQHFTYPNSQDTT